MSKHFDPHRNLVARGMREADIESATDKIMAALDGNPALRDQFDHAAKRAQFAVIAPADTPAEAAVKEASALVSAIVNPPAANQETAVPSVNLADLRAAVRDEQAQPAPDTDKPAVWPFKPGDTFDANAEAVVATTEKAWSEQHLPPARIDDVNPFTPPGATPAPPPNFDERDLLGDALPADAEGGTEAAPGEARAGMRYPLDTLNAMKMGGVRDARFELAVGLLSARMHSPHDFTESKIGEIARVFLALADEMYRQAEDLGWASALPVTPDLMPHEQASVQRGAIAQALVQVTTATEIEQAREAFTRRGMLMGQGRQ